MSDRPLPEDAVASHHRKKASYRVGLSDGLNTLNTNQAGLRIAIYTRVSSEEQVEGHSLGAQKNICREFTERRKWVIVEYYEDAGFSAKDDRRPAFKRMIADAEQGLFDAILVHKLDRFSRSIEQTLSYFKRLNECEVVITSATENFDFTRPEGRLFFNMMAVFAQWYLENLSSESIKGHEELFRKGLHNGTAPFGYQKDKKARKLVVIPEEAEIVKAAFELSASGNYTHRMIADFLNTQFKTRKGRLFSKDTVTNMLRNEFYYGMVSLRENIRPGIHEPIITKELYDKSQEVTRDRMSTNKGRLMRQHKKDGSTTTTIRYYMLQRIICCDSCQRHLRIQTSNYYNYYKEVSLERGLECDHAGRSVRMNETNDNLLKLLSHIILPTDWQEEVTRRVQSRDVVDQIKKQRNQLEEKIRRLDDVYVTQGHISRIQYSEEHIKLRETLNSLVIPEQTNVIEKGLMVESLGEYIIDATTEELTQLCRSMLDSVYTDFVDNRISRIKPLPEFLELFRVAAEKTGLLEIGDDGGFLVIHNN